MIAPSSSDAIAVRVRIVEEHVSLENEHNLDGIMGTFGEAARYDDEPWGAHYMGRQEVREFYGQLLQAMPDLHIDIQRRHVGEDAIVLEVVIRGRHLGAWRGLPATGRQIDFPLCGVYTFDEGNKLAGEKIYYDRASVLRQLGVFHEPRACMGASPPHLFILSPWRALSRGNAFSDLSGGKLVDPASLSCSALIFDTNKNAASGQSPRSRNADGAVMC